MGAKVAQDLCHSFFRKNMVKISFFLKFKI